VEVASLHSTGLAAKDETKKHYVAMPDKSGKVGMNPRIILSFSPQ
jgi:hypothetical protein